MIKVYCDECGKEIIGNVNATIEQEEIKDGLGVVLTLINKVVHICDECQYKKLTCGFKIGDQVITSTGKVGKITDICTCGSCKKRGFYEPTVEVGIGNGSIWITDNDKRVNFRSFYKIGDQVFGNIDEQSILHNIKYQEEEINNRRQELYELSQQLYVVNNLKKKK